MNGFLFEETVQSWTVIDNWVAAYPGLNGASLATPWRDVREIPGGDQLARCGFRPVGALSADPPLSAMRIHARQIRLLSNRAGSCGYACRPVRQLEPRAAGMYA